MVDDDGLEFINTESNHIGSVVRRMTELMYTLVIALNATGLVTTINALPANSDTRGILISAAVVFAAGMLWTLGVVVYSIVLVYRLQNVLHNLKNEFLAGRMTIAELYKRYSTSGPKTFSALYLVMPSIAAFGVGLVIGFVAIFLQY